MVNVVVRRALGVVALAGGAALLNASARYATSKRMDASQKLADALLQWDRLKEASEVEDGESEAALAACSAYLINVAYQAAYGMAGPPTIDAIGVEKTATTGEGEATSSVITTAHEPETRWQFEMEAKGTGRVSGSRRLTSARFTGHKVSMRTPDTVSIRLENGYVASIESDLEFSGNLLSAPIVGRTTAVFGTASLSDNRGNVGL
ncbi:MAG: hypothetical protein ABJA67_13485, partial [Chthonomonadales bacterium]